MTSAYYPAQQELGTPTSLAADDNLTAPSLHEVFRDFGIRPEAFQIREAYARHFPEATKAQCGVVSVLAEVMRAGAKRTMAWVAEEARVSSETVHKTVHRMGTAGLAKVSGGERYWIEGTDGKRRPRRRCMTYVAIWSQDIEPHRGDLRLHEIIRQAREAGVPDSAISPLARSRSLQQLANLASSFRKKGGQIEESELKSRPRANESQACEGSVGNPLPYRVETEQSEPARRQRRTVLIASNLTSGVSTRESRLRSPDEFYGAFATAHTEAVRVGDNNAPATAAVVLRLGREAGLSATSAVDLFREVVDDTLDVISRGTTIYKPGAWARRTFEDWLHQETAPSATNSVKVAS